MSKTGVAGYIVSFPIPEVVMGINAFMLGAQSVNPDFKVKIVWVNSWFDPGKEADAAKALFDQGADIIVQHTDSPAPLQIAEERKLHGFGQVHDMIKFAPEGAAHLDRSTTGARTTSSASRRCSTAPGSRRQTWDGIAEGRHHARALHQHARRRRQAAAKDDRGQDQVGRAHPFTGPIYKQDGTRRGRRPARSWPTATLLGMNWYVKGIDDKLPQ